MFHFRVKYSNSLTISDDEMAFLRDVSRVHGTLTFREILDCRYQDGVEWTMREQVHSENFPILFAPKEMSHGQMFVCDHSPETKQHVKISETSGISALL